MPIDPDLAIGAELGEQTFSWTASDVLLYHLALGAGGKPTDERELRYAYERDLRVLPTFATVAGNAGRQPRQAGTELSPESSSELSPQPPAQSAARPSGARSTAAERPGADGPPVSLPGVEIDLAKVVHGTQAITVHRPIPVVGSAVARTRIVDVLDKGKAAVILNETVVTEPDGRPLWTAQAGIFARGEGGFGGRRGSSDRIELPARAPDAVLETPTLPQQALLYRLCGDRNPLHADPESARGAGFDVPILHGLCTYGIVAKAVTDALLDADVARVVSFSARFSGIVLPGETLRTAVWRDGDRLLVDVRVPDRGDAPALSDAVLTTT